MSKTYLLLDGARFAHLPTLLQTLDSTLTPYPLYATTPYAPINDLGPWLLEVDPTSAVAQTFVREWLGKHGLWLESDAPQPQVLEHLRSLIHIDLADTGTVLFRFYDPCVAVRWLAPLSYLERDRLMGPVQLIRWSHGHGERHEVRRQQHTAPSARYAPSPWLKLSVEQLEYLNQSQVQAFDRRLLAHVLQFNPDALTHLDAAQQLSWAATCRQNAGRYGLTSEADVLGWAGLYAEHGEQFPELPAHQTYRALLLQPGLSPSQRLRRAQTEQIRQLILAEETLP